jgi:hypothetical protein
MKAKLKLLNEQVTANNEVRKMLALRDYVSDLNSSFPTSVAPFIYRGISYSSVMVIHCAVQYVGHLVDRVCCGSFSLSISSLSHKSFTFPLENCHNCAEPV